MITSTVLFAGSLTPEQEPALLHVHCAGAGEHTLVLLKEKMPAFDFPARQSPPSLRN